MHVTLTAKTLRVCSCTYTYYPYTPYGPRRGGLTVILPSSMASNRRTESTDHITDHYVPY